MTDTSKLNSLSFGRMSAEFRIRDHFQSPIQVLGESNILPGMRVLDFGCGPGGFCLAAANLVGPEGMVYAVDNHPFSIESIKKTSFKQRLTNIRTFFGSTFNEVDTESVDMILLYDVMHDLSDTRSVMYDFHRVLKTDGILSVKDHHLDEKVILKKITVDCLFVLKERRINLFQFNKLPLGDIKT